MWIPILLACLSAALIGMLSGPFLRRLPEPVLRPAEAKVPYAALATGRFAAGVASCSLGCLLITVARVPGSAWPLWWVLSTLGVLLVAVDAVTTWLPLPLTRALWALSLLAAAVVALDAGPPAALRILIGAAGAGLFFWLCWRLIGGLGFGDVRLAPVLGAASAAVSYQVLLGGFVIGTIAGAAYGLLRLGAGRAGPFPYGPALLSGVVAGAAWLG